jgi:CRISPR-associated endonuclease/helicase Cas3
VIPSLSPEEFPAFLEAVHGKTPFPWQRKLAATVGTTHTWPRALGIPTSGGKTTAIDIAVFHLALEADKGFGRRAPVRIAFTVDRRLVVDDTFERAKILAEALRVPTGVDERPDILQRVSARLALLSETPEVPLVVAKLRGGTFKEADWVRTPTQPTVLVSTVDQVGSRLLFRGYGISDRMKPIHAGLLGVDTLFLLDEAHLSQPFVETVQALQRYQQPTGLPSGIVTLSATQHEEVTLDTQEDDLQHPVLGPRLRASKMTELVLVSKEEVVATFVKNAVRLSCLNEGSARAIGVIVNRVKRARDIYNQLAAEVGTSADVVLLIGRSRPLARDQFMQRVLPRIHATGKVQGDKPIFVVSTQCIEAGADLDFDAMISEISALDSLRQRFGRLDRLGALGRSRAMIIASKDQVAAKAWDFLYGFAVKQTWELLDSKARKSGKGKSAKSEIDFGIVASISWLPSELGNYIAPREQAPILLPAHVQAWAQTSPIPAADPEVSAFLHGLGTKPADVQVIWRADLPEQDSSVWVDRVAVCPPVSLESISVSIGAARSWLANQDTVELSDSEGEKEEAVGTKPKMTRSREVLRWRGPENSEVVRSTDIKPDDILVVPATYGGCDIWGWDPTSAVAVEDIGDEAQRLARGTAVLRLFLTKDQLDPQLADCSNSEIRTKLSNTSPVWRDYLKSYRKARVLRDASEMPVALTHKARAATHDVSTTEDDSSVQSNSGKAVLLVDHSKGIEVVARGFVTQLGLPSASADDVTLAAFLHDAGKAHPAFKLWLCGGDELRAASSQALAKSGMRLGTKARTNSGLPKGARHEAASIRFALAHPRFTAANDPDLVLWLIGTHHGWGRPFFPAGVTWPPVGESFVADLGDGLITSQPGPQVEDLAFGWADRFDRLKRRYGPWRLAWLETLVRLADHRRSEQEQEST